MTPASIILDLLRTYRRRNTPVKEIMATGALFGFSDNAMRVNLSRLVNRGVVANTERGRYQLSDVADPVNDFVEAWRLGEARVKQWDNETWLVVVESEDTAPKRDWALTANGFRLNETKLWVRPDNLTLNRDEMETRLYSLGVDARSVVMSNAILEKDTFQTWISYFDLDALKEEYIECNRLLEESATQLKGKKRDEALKESFHLGGKAVHLLAKDPLIPSAVMDPSPRMQLWRTMQAYDELGRSVWHPKNQHARESMPTPLSTISNF